MATLTRRLQVLVDQERFDRLERLAQQRGSTIAVLVRDALDRAYPAEGLPADVAADRFLARPPIDFGQWADLKREIEDSFNRDLST